MQLGNRPWSRFRAAAAADGSLGWTPDTEAIASLFDRISALVIGKKYADSVHGFQRPATKEAQRIEVATIAEFDVGAAMRFFSA